MSKKFYVFFVAVLALALVGGIYHTSADAQKAAPAEKPVKVETCYGCHAPIKEFHATGKHKDVNCVSCHTGLDKHVANVKDRPVTRTDHKACGACHKEQYESFFTMNWKKLARIEKAQPKEKAPAFDLLMMPHGFTKEHNIQRSHSFMLIDHLLIDRGYGGRFQPKAGWAMFGMSGDLKAWDVLEDRYPDVKEHKAFIPESAPAANPVCLNCKSQDHILKWAYMGDPVTGTTWSRTSKVFEFAKDLNHALNCYMCHDPHAAKPRVVRDALIQALTRPQADTLWHKDPKRTKIDVKDMGLRGYTRKIALLEKTDTKLQCGQCHVEYNCNPGTEISTGKPITMADQRTNHFPFKDVFQMYDHYNALDFRDFKHAITGALLWKAQHPEAETYWNSKHDKAGVQCSDCHMPKMTDPKTKKTYTSHWQTNPKNYLKETCLKCHPDWNETKAAYVIDSVANHLKGKARKAEFWLTRLINKFEEAKAVGVDEETLKQARVQHDKAHIHWEWWTAETSAGFHNIDQAKLSLTTGIVDSKKGIEILQKAIDTKRAAK